VTLEASFGGLTKIYGDHRLISSLFTDNRSPCGCRPWRGATFVKTGGLLRGWTEPESSDFAGWVEMEPADADAVYTSSSSRCINALSDPPTAPSDLFSLLFLDQSTPPAPDHLPH